MANLLEKLLRTGEGRTLKRLRAYSVAINNLEDEFASLSDIRDSINELRYYRRFMGAIGGTQPG